MSNPTKSLKLATARYFGLLVLFGICFLAFRAASAEAGGSFSAKADPAPTPVKKLPTPKKPAAPTNKQSGIKSPVKPAATPAPKTDASKVIVSVTAARVRSAASTSSAEIRKLKLGTVLSVVQKPQGTSPWYKVQLPADSKAASGWMSSSVVSIFNPAKAESAYRQLAEKYYKKKGLSFTDGVELYEFLSRIEPELKSSAATAELTLRRWQVLAIVLGKIPIERSNDKTYKNFTDAQDRYIVYSDPAGQFFVRSELFWQLQKKYTGTAIGEEIAWAAARTSLPGECEGYVNCYLYLLRETDGEYLTLYPDGKHSLEALKNITAFLAPIVADLKEKKIYDGPTDVSDRAEYNRHLSELRSIISKVPFVDKEKVLRQIALMAEAYR